MTLAPAGYQCPKCQGIYGPAAIATRLGRCLDCIDFLAELEALKDSGDAEGAHGEADRLLLDLLRWAYYIGEIDDLGEDFERIIEAYEAVPKWYA